LPNHPEKSTIFGNLVSSIECQPITRLGIRSVLRDRGNLLYNPRISRKNSIFIETSDMVPTLPCNFRMISIWTRNCAAGHHHFTFTNSGSPSQKISCRSPPGEDHHLGGWWKIITADPWEKSGSQITTMALSPSPPGKNHLLFRVADINCNRD
jgi:hypothetical protein